MPCFRKLNCGLLSQNDQYTRFQTFRRNKIGTEKNELTLLYSGLIKINSSAKLIVLRLMVTRYI